MQEIKELILWFTPFGLLSAVVWSIEAHEKTLLYYIGFGLFVSILMLAGYGLVKLDRELQ